MVMMRRATEVDPDFRRHWWPLVHRCGPECEDPNYFDVTWLNPIGRVLIPNRRR